MANKNIKLKSGNDILYPQTKASLLLNDDGTKWEAPKGTNVEANPTETGTTDLTRLKVGSTVYNIPSGGGSSSGGGFNGFTLSISNSSDSKLLKSISLYALTTNGIVKITSINDVINNVLYLFVDKTNIQSISFYCSSTTAYLSMGETTTSINFTSANTFMGGAKLLIFLNSDLSIYFSTSGGGGN